MDEEDEVARRAREAAERRAEADEERRIAEERLQHRMAELQAALPRLIREVATEVAARTAYPVFQTPDGIACLLGPVHAYRTQPLFVAALTRHSLAEVEDRDWSIAFGCKAPIILDEDGERSARADHFLGFDNAREFGVEASLDGLAALVDADEEILSPDVIYGAQPSEPPPVGPTYVAPPEPAAAQTHPAPRPALLFAAGVLIGGALLVVALGLIARLNG